jgi:hypothetical protein
VNVRVRGFFVAGMCIRREKQILILLEYLKGGFIIVYFINRVQLSLNKAKLRLFGCHSLICVRLFLFRVNSDVCLLQAFTCLIVV